MDRIASLMKDVLQLERGSVPSDGTLGSPTPAGSPYHLGKSGLGTASLLRSITQTSHVTFTIVLKKFPLLFRSRLYVSLCPLQCRRSRRSALS